MMRVTISVTSRNRSARECVVAGAFVVVVTASSDLGPGAVAVRCPARLLCPCRRGRAHVPVRTRRARLPAPPPRRARGRFLPRGPAPRSDCLEPRRSEEHTSELQSRGHLVCRLLLEKKKPLIE